MKLKEGFVLREVCGEKIIVGEGLKAIDFGHLISVNDTAAWIWSKAEEQGEFSAESLAETLCDTYEVAPDQALADVQALLDKWQQTGLIA